jgi:hypothetical protein
MLITPQERLKNLVVELSEKNYNITLANDRGDGKRASYNTCKKGISVELLVLKSHYMPVIRVAINAKHRAEYNETVVAALSRRGMIKDHKVSTKEFPTYTSDNLLEDFIKVITAIESNDEIENSMASWKENGGLESGTWFIVDTIMSAARRGHSVGLGREPYEAIRSLVEVNRYNADLGLTHGEHVTPIDFMNQTGVALAKSGASEEALFDFIIRNHKVVYITPEQAAYLDHDMGLKTSMPEGWRDGDSPFARLDEAKILYKI